MCGSSSACRRELRPPSVGGASSSGSSAAAGKGVGSRKAEAMRAEKASTSCRGVPAADHPSSLLPRAALSDRSLGTSAPADEESVLCVAADRALRSSCSAYSCSVLGTAGLLAASGQDSGDHSAIQAALSVDAHVLGARLAECGRQGGYKTRTGHTAVRVQEAKRTGVSRSMSRSRTSMHRTSMSRSSAPVDVSGGRARRPRHHPRPRRVVGAGGAREEPARRVKMRGRLSLRLSRFLASKLVSWPPC